ncbi:MAG: flavodoxin family protein [Deltaproteobacteria bacterium]|nr:flavodoxin family protein [Deltaproteobacteria bacterium]
MRDIKIIGIIGSPRKNRNSDTLVQQMLDGCKSVGALIDKIYLKDLEIKPCQAHKLQDGKGCMVSDGMDVIYKVFEDVDGLILGTPVYYNSVPAQMKLMIDRSYCLAKAESLGPGKRKYITSVRRKKKGVVISVGGSGTNPDCVLPIFDIWSNEVNLEIIDALCVSEGQLGVIPMESEKTLEKAFQKGRNLAKRLIDCC